MLIRFKQFWKICVSGALFGCLGTGGFLCTVILWPVLALLFRDRHLRQLRAEQLMRIFFRLFVFGLEKSGILRVEIQGLPPAEQLRGSIIAAKHPSYLDIVLLIALIPGTMCVVKEEVWNNFFFGPLVRMAGFIPNLGPEAVLERGREALARGRTMVIFPEGTRTSPGTPRRFQRGAAHLALRVGAPILPLLITVDPPLLAKGDRWYQIPVPTCRYRIHCGEPILCGDPGPDPGSFSLRARALTLVLQQYFQ